MAPRLKTTLAVQDNARSPAHVRVYCDVPLSSSPLLYFFCLFEIFTYAALSKQTTGLIYISSNKLVPFRPIRPVRLCVMLCVQPLPLRHGQLLELLQDDLRALDHVAPSHINTSGARGCDVWHII